MYGLRHHRGRQCRAVIIIFLGVVLVSTRAEAEAGDACTPTWFSRFTRDRGLHNALDHIQAAYAARFNTTPFEVVPMGPEYDAGEETRAVLETITSGPRSPFDLVHMLVGAAPDFFAAGYLEDLSSLYDAIDLEALLKPPIHGLLQSRDMRAALPLYSIRGSLVFFNSSLARIGATAPTTWDEAFAICDELIADHGYEVCVGGAPFAGAFRTSLSFLLDSLVLQTEGKAFYERWMMGSIPYDDPRWLSMLATMHDWLSRPNVDLNAHVGLFLGFRSVFSVGIAGIVGAVPLHRRSDFAHARMPQWHTRPPGMPRIEPVYLHTVAVPSHAVQKDAAMQMATHLVGCDTQQALAREFVHIPAYDCPLTNLHTYKRRAIADLDAADGLVVYSRDALHGPAIMLNTVDEALELLANANGDRSAVGEAAARLEAARIMAVFSTASAPSFSPQGGVFSGPVEVSLTTRTRNATMFFTLDGTLPFESSQAYVAPVVLPAPPPNGPNTTVIFRAVTYHDDFHRSAFAVATFVMVSEQTPAHAAPVSRESGGVLSPAVVALLVSGAVIVVLVCVVALMTAHRRARPPALLTLADTDQFLVPFAELVFEASIGRGGFGEVYRAQWRGSAVAVKMNADLSVGDETRQAFLKEAALMVRLRHPHLISLMGVCVEPSLCIVTEYMARGSLFGVLHSGDLARVPPAMRQRWMVQIARGMRFLHAADPPVLHRDLKSPNILLSRAWVAKIADFGLSGVSRVPQSSSPSVPRNASSAILHSAPLSADSERRVLSGASLGTRKRKAKGKGKRRRRKDRAVATVLEVSDDHHGTTFWCAPELLTRTEAHSTKSDVYAFAVVCWEILAAPALLYHGRSPIQVAMGVVRDGLRPDLGAVDEEGRSLVPALQLMWAQMSDVRPSFAEIPALLKSHGIADTDADTVYDSRATTTLSSGPIDLLLVSFSLWPLMAAALTHIPAVYCGFVRGLHQLVTDQLVEHHGWLASASVHTLVCAFPVSQLTDALAVIDTVTTTAVPCICAPEATVESAPAVLPLSVSVMAKPAVTVDALAGPCLDAACIERVVRVTASLAPLDMGVEATVRDQYMGVEDITRISPAFASTADRLVPLPDPSGLPGASVVLTVVTRFAPAEYARMVQVLTPSVSDVAPVWEMDPYQLSSMPPIHTGSTRPPRTGQCWVTHTARGHIPVLCKFLASQPRTLDGALAFAACVARIHRATTACPVILPFTGVSLAGDQLGVSHRRIIPGNLHQWLATKPDTQARALVALRIAEGLHNLHAAGLLMGESFTPFKVLVDQSLHVWFTGVDQQAFMGAVATAAVHPCPEYVAPEVLRGGSHTRASDVYSLAAMIVAVMCDAPLFAKGLSPVQTARRVLDGSRPAIGDGLARHHRALLQRCLAEPGERPDLATFLRVWRGAADTRVAHPHRTNISPRNPFDAEASEEGSDPTTTTMYSSYGETTRTGSGSYSLCFDSDSAERG